MKKKEKIDKGYKTSQVVLASFAFGACMVFWSVYGSYVPLMVDAKLSTLPIAPVIVSTLTGAVMTIDNFFGLIFQPIFGARSDHMRSRYGKRMPYVIFGILSCSVLFVLIPLAAKIAGMAGLFAMMAVIIAFNFAMSVWRAPCVAIMPDMVPVEYQSDGNAIVNLVYVVFGLVAMGSASVLAMCGFGDAINSGDYTVVFVFGALLSCAALVVLLTCVKWKDNRNEAVVKTEKTAKEKKAGIRDLGLPKDVLRSMLFMMLTLFCISGASDGFNTYFTLYATKNLGMNATTATLLRTVSTAGALFLAIPAGAAGRKLGRIKTVRVGVIVVALNHLVMFIAPYIPSLNEMAILVIMTICNAIYAGAFMMVNINTLPIMLAIGGEARFGAFTGFYYTATFTAAVVCPVVIGFIVGITNYNMLNMFCMVVMALAIVFLAQVKHGDKLSTDEEAKLAEAVKNAD